MIRLKITYIDKNIIGTRGDKITHIYIKGLDESSVFNRLYSITKALDKEGICYVIHCRNSLFSGYEKLHTFTKNE